METYCVDCVSARESNSNEPCKSCIPKWDNGVKPGFVPKDDTVCTGNCVDCTHKSCFKETSGETQAVVKEFVESQDDPVEHPGHYNQFPIEVIDMIKLILNATEGLTPFQAGCLQNELKYRLRAGFKGDAAEDINKAMKYREFRLNK
jgi:hypothetical protein